LFTSFYSIQHAATLSAAVATAFLFVSLSVGHTSVLCQNEWTAERIVRMMPYPLVGSPLTLVFGTIMFINIFARGQF